MALRQAGAVKADRKDHVEAGATHEGIFDVNGQERNMTSIPFLLVASLVDSTAVTPYDSRT